MRKKADRFFTFYEHSDENIKTYIWAEELRAAWFVGVRKTHIAIYADVKVCSSGDI